MLPDDTKRGHVRRTYENHKDQGRNQNLDGNFRGTAYDIVEVLTTNGTVLDLAGSRSRMVAARGQVPSGTAPDAGPDLDVAVEASSNESG